MNAGSVLNYQIFFSDLSLAHIHIQYIQYTPIYTRICANQPVEVYHCPAEMGYQYLLLLLLLLLILL